MPRQSDLASAVQAFATEAGIPCAWNGEGKGLGFRWVPGGLAELTYTDEDGSVRYPLGQGVKVSIYQLEAAAKFARAFGLTPNWFGETERVVVESGEVRKAIILALNEAGASVQVVASSSGLEISKLLSPAILAIHRAKSLFLQKGEVSS